MAKIIGLVQLKGGAGRSTVATTLAGGLSAGHKVALIDCDMPQGTSAAWASIRNDDQLTLRTAQDHRELVNLVGDLQDSHDYILIDTPPRMAEVSRAVILMADLSLMPVGASGAEIWATSDVVPIIEQARKARPDIDVRIIWTRYRAYTKAAQEISSEAVEQLGLPALETTLGLRVAYPEALASGQTVGEIGDKAARYEATSLIAEIITLMRDKT